MSDNKTEWLNKAQKELHNKGWKVIEQIEEFITSSDYNFLKTTEIPFSDNINVAELAKYNHPLDYLVEQLPDLAQSVIYKQITYGMIIDFCYYMQEAFSCARRGRISVAFSLLRRPLVYNLIILLRMIYDNHFYEKFTLDSSYDPTVYKPEELKMMLKEFDEVKIMSPINCDIIFNLIFDKNNPTSIINLSNRAIHPTTTRKWNKTGELNFNFIFAVKEDVTALIDTFYRNILAILAFYFELFNIIISPYIPKEHVDSILNNRYSEFVKNMS